MFWLGLMSGCILGLLSGSFLVILLMLNFDEEVYDYEIEEEWIGEKE